MVKVHIPQVYDSPSTFMTPLHKNMLKNHIMKHPDSGKLACYVVSKGKMYPDMKSVFDDLVQKCIVMSMGR